MAVALGGCSFQRYEAQPLEARQFAEAFEQRRLDLPGLRDFMPECGLPSAPWPRAEWDAAALSCAALFFDPGLARARARTEVFRARERIAAQGLEIGVGAELEHHSERDGGRTPWSVGANLDFAVEAPGKRAARMEAALARTDAALVELERRAQALRREVAEALQSYAEARHKLRLLDARAELLRQGQALLERRRDVGYASPFELATVTSELQRAELANAAASSAAEAARAALAARLGVPAAAFEGTNLLLDGYGELPPHIAEDAGPLQAGALTGRGEIRLALQEYAVAEATLKEAIAAQYPDFTLSPGYLFDQADRVWRFALALVPPGGRNAGAIAEARARRDEAARAVEETQAAIIGEVRAAMSGDWAARRAAHLAERLLAAAEAQEAVARRRLEHGEGDRLELVHARLATLDARLRRAELIGAAWRARLRLEAAVSGAPGGLATRTSS